MLQRLGLVIHWLMFVLGSSYILVAIYNITVGGMRETVGDTVVGMIFLFGLYGMGWVINFILSGHKSPLPWVRNVN